MFNISANECGLSKIKPLPLAFLSHVVKQHTHTPSPRVKHVIAKLLITRYFTSDASDHQMLLPRWDLWRYLVARSNCTNQDPISEQKVVQASKDSRQIWTCRRMANLMRIKNDDCSRIRCGLGQSGWMTVLVGEWSVMARRNLNRISYGQQPSPTRYNHLAPMH